MAKVSLTQSRLLQLLDYEATTGVFRNKVTRASSAIAGMVAGHSDAEGYLQICVDGKPYRAHRLAWLWMTGSWPVGGIDHANGDVADNSWQNLREATHSQNCANRKCINKHGYKGVVKSKNRWYAQNRKDGKLYVSRGFDTAEEAHEAYVKRAKELYGEFARAA